MANKPVDDDVMEWAKEVLGFGEEVGKIDEVREVLEIPQHLKRYQSGPSMKFAQDGRFAGKLLARRAGTPRPLCKVAVHQNDAAPKLSGRRRSPSYSGRGMILLCNYDLATVPPEMRKLRRVVVISPKSYDKPVSMTVPGKCIVIPFSATEPRERRPSHFFVTLGRYREE